MWALVTLSLLAGVAAAPAEYTYKQLRAFGAASNDGLYPTFNLTPDRANPDVIYGITRGGQYLTHVIFAIQSDGSGYRILHAFDPTAGEDSFPTAPLVHGSDGALYCTTSTTLFSLHTDGTGFNAVYGFPTNNNESAIGLLEASDGVLYGGIGGRVYKLNKNGTGFALVETNLVYPSSLLEASDGAIYGINSYGGDSGDGSVFRLNKDGTGYTNVFSFESLPFENGPMPLGLIEGSDGVLYGTTAKGWRGATGATGSLFRLNRDGSGFQSLTNIGLNSDSAPCCLVEGTNGALHGVTGRGEVFRIGKRGEGYTVLRQVGTSRAGLVRGLNGVMYGASIEGWGFLFSITSDGGYTILKGFQGYADGSQPSRLVAGRNGLLYGTTASSSSFAYQPSVFSMARDGKDFKILMLLPFFFRAVTEIGLLEGNDNVLYGTTEVGGSADVGMLFALNRDGSGYRMLHSFQTNGLDGRNPSADLLEAQGGVLYGTTHAGGPEGGGSVFRINKDGTGYGVLQTFAIGSSPNELIEGSDQVLYGTTGSGGSSCCGTVFRLSGDGTGFTILKQFSSAEYAQEGGFPRAPLLEGGDRALYGTTGYGGAADRGTLFKLNRDGTGFRVLYAFQTNGVDGQGKISQLVEGDDGALYGSTFQGGVAGGGTLFRIERDGSGYRVIHSFPSRPSDGSQPWQLIKAQDKLLYGVTWLGGVGGGGTIFTMLAMPTLRRPERLLDGSRLLQGSGIAGLSYRIQFSPSLTVPIRWESLGTSRAQPDGLFEFTDLLAPDQPQGFYRAVLTP